MGRPKRFIARKFPQQANLAGCMSAKTASRARQHSRHLEEKKEVQHECIFPELLNLSAKDGQ